MSQIPPASLPHITSGPANTPVTTTALTTNTLPPCAPPAVPAQRPPSPGLMPPHSKASTPMGCELLLHNANTGTDDPKATVEKAILDIISTNPTLALFPIKARFKTRDLNGYCALRLEDQITRRAGGPRPDLLGQWITPLREHNPRWVVDWAPAELGKDKRLWVGLKPVKGTVTKAELEIIAKRLSAQGFHPVGQFVMEASNTAVFVAPNLHIAECFKEKNQVDVPDTTSLRFRIHAFDVLIPQWAFELVITGIENADDALPLDFDRFFSSKYVGDDGKSLWHSSRIVDGKYLFLMVDWNATDRVLRDVEDFRQHYSELPSIQPPRLVYAVNSGFRSDNSSKNFKAATAAFGNELSSINSRLDKMTRQVEQVSNQQLRLENQQLQAEVRQAKMMNALTSLSTQVNAIGSYMANQATALLMAREEFQLNERRQNIERQIEFRRQLLLTTAPSDTERTNAVRCELETYEKEYQAILDKTADMSQQVITLATSLPHIDANRIEDIDNDSTDFLTDSLIQSASTDSITPNASFSIPTAPGTPVITSTPRRSASVTSTVTTPTTDRRARGQTATSNKRPNQEEQNSSPRKARRSNTKRQASNANATTTTTEPLIETSAGTGLVTTTQKDADMEDLAN